MSAFLQHVAALQNLWELLRWFILIYWFLRTLNAIKSMAKQDSRLDAAVVGMAQEFKSRFQSEYTDQPRKQSLWTLRFDRDMVYFSHQQCVEVTWHDSLIAYEVLSIRTFTRAHAVVFRETGPDDPCQETLRSLTNAKFLGVLPLMGSMGQVR